MSDEYKNVPEHIASIWAHLDNTSAGFGTAVLLKTKDASNEVKDEQKPESNMKPKRRQAPQIS